MNEIILVLFCLSEITLHFDLILEYLLDTTGREFSAENILKFLSDRYKSVSTDTLYTYVNALCKALIIKKVYRYNIHGKSILKTLNKYYVTDLGIAQIKNNNPKFKNFLVLENIVYNDLIIKGYEVYVGKTKNGEIDFIIKKDGNIKYIQVTYELSNEEVIERESGAFRCIEDNYPKYVLSLDKFDFSRDGINHINIIDFLMNDEF